MILAHLKPTVTHQQAKAEAELLLQKLRTRSESVDGIELLPLRRQVEGNARSVLPILFAATSLVLLLACVNVANLLLARATARQREFAIRAALGAGQLRVIRQLLAESMILAFLGGGCGLLLAWSGVQLLSVLSPANLPRLREIGMDSVVVAFALALTLGTGFNFGLAPAYQAAKVRVNDTLQEHTRGATAGRWSRGFRGLLVIFEVAVSLVLLVSAGLLGAHLDTATSFG